MNKIRLDRIFRRISLVVGVILGILGIIQIISIPRNFSRYLYYPVLYFLMVLWLVQPDLFIGIRKIEKWMNLTFLLGLYLLCWIAMFMIIRYSSYPLSYLSRELVIWLIIMLPAFGFMYDGYKQLNNQKAIYLRAVLIIFTIITLFFFYLLGVPRPGI